jgi:uncharacterized protein (TIGR02186 family)
MTRQFAKIIVLCLFGASLVAAREPVLVPDVSQRDIEIRYSFSGAELLLFGAIIYPDGRVPTEQADIAVVLKGPTKSILIREKQKVAGIWLNAESARFRSVPGYYAIASSRPLGKLIDERTAAIYELGLRNIQLSPSDDADPAIQQRFQKGLVSLMRKQGLFGEQPESVEITQGVLYRARLAIPGRVPVGRYTAETFLIRRGKIYAAATRKIEIRKSGFGRFVAESAADLPLAYGVFAVTLSAFLGWAAGAIFRRI